MNTGFSIWASGKLVFPINVKLSVVDDAFDPVLPVLAGWDRTDQINTLMLAVHK
jgi:hypothetical protein